MPVEALYCKGVFCKRHESFHNDIVNACLYASESALVTKVSRRRHTIPVWNDEVRVARQNAIWWHTLWKDNNSHTSGIIFDIRQKNRREYHYALRSPLRPRPSNLQLALSSGVARPTRETRRLRVTGEGRGSAGTL